jgi:two-component system, cell cycle response regulator DivK
MTHALIIDDNAQNINILAQLLTLAGIDSTKVLQPTQLEGVLQNLAKTGIVFLDLEMPGLDGFEVLTMLKSDARFQGVPIVAYTVHVSEIDVAYREGFDGFIGKPLNADKFPDQVDRLLHGEGVWETS